ncbi:MAG: homoserine dehydrogenase [Candidatus Omnitrophica bacterium]|nr:homoserine dehydrogenase [Candidatus Omnitrophota bacterium]
MKEFNLGIIGLGNVGSGVVRILNERRFMLAQKIGSSIQIKRICDINLKRKHNVHVSEKIFTKNAYDIINDPQIDIVVELIGGIHPAYEYIFEALKKGKNVVTANKALLAEYGQQLFTHALDCNKNIYFEASVGAGIPIIKSLREGLVANKFHSVFGIVNGTSNFVLSCMSESHCSFNEALHLAKERGFAEKDPTLDIEGVDSAHKLILLTYLAFGRFVNMKDVWREGISSLSLADIRYAQELNLAIKLLAVAKRKTDSLEVRVHPALINNRHPLAAVNGVNNAIYVCSDLAGDLLFSGPGAGQSSAASAVVSDIVDVIQDLKAGMFRPTLNTLVDSSIKRLRNPDEFESRYYIRFTALDKPGVLAKISSILARYNISIASVTQKERHKAKSVPIVMVIHEAKERHLRQALVEIDKLPVIKEKSVAIRIEEL